MKKLIFFPILILIVAAVGCEKNEFFVTERTSPEGNALVKVGYFSATNVLPNVQVYANGDRVSNPIAYPFPYPGGGQNTNGSNNADYLVIPPGSNKFEIFIPNTGTSIPMSKLFETSQSFEANKRYIMFVADTGATMTSWVVNVDTPTPDSGSARLNFVNAMPNVASLDLYKGANATVATLVASDVKYKATSDFFNVNFGTDSFFVRVAGSPATSTPVARRSFVLANRRLYTVLARGYSGQTGNRAPNISATVNQ